MAATASSSLTHIGSSYPTTTTTAATSSSGKGSSTFRYPPIHAFPPFYTLQHNPVSRAQQLSQWRSLILDFCRFHRIFSLSPLPSSTDSSSVNPHKTLFANASIQRSLSTESIRTILSDLVEHKGAVWEDQLTSTKKSAGGNNAKVYVYWKTPAQWGDSIYEWVMATGQNKSIMTLFELNQGELVEGQGMFRALTTRMIDGAY